MPTKQKGQLRIAIFWKKENQYKERGYNNDQILVFKSVQQKEIYKVNSVMKIITQDLFSSYGGLFHRPKTCTVGW